MGPESRESPIFPSVSTPAESTSMVMAPKFALRRNRDCGYVDAMANRQFNETRGRKRLLRWLASSEGSQSELARRLKVSQTAVHWWTTGRQRPTPPYRKALVRILGIPEDEWMTSSERRIATGASS